MIREIKFRAWFVECKEMEQCERIDLPNETHHKDVVAMQYTGLKDKNGKEIYEGDIVQGYYHDRLKKFTVVFKASKYCCGFVATDNANPYVSLWYEGFEVIGNIYENGDLL